MGAGANIHGHLGKLNFAFRAAIRVVLIEAFNGCAIISLLQKVPNFFVENLEIVAFDHIAGHEHVFMVSLDIAGGQKVSILVYKVLVVDISRMTFLQVVFLEFRPLVLLYFFVADVGFVCLPPLLVYDVCHCSRVWVGVLLVASVYFEEFFSFSD